MEQLTFYERDEVTDRIPDWIPCSRMLPPENVPVLVCVRSLFINYEYVQDIAWLYHGKWIMSGVEYWLPLPETPPMLPKEVKKNA